MIRLYPVTPMGLGTRDIESLSSYLLRLAAAHCTTVGILLRTLHDQKDYDAIHDVSRMQHEPIDTLIRPNKTTNSAIKVISDATGIPKETLSSMTLMSLRSALSRQVGFYSRGLRWCSACIREQKQSGLPVYFKLIWMFVDLPICIEHRCKLRSSCPSCFSSQTSVGRRYTLGNCVSCGNDLIGKDPPLPNAMAMLKSGAEIANLVAYIATSQIVKFPLFGFITSLEILERESHRARSESIFRAATGCKQIRSVRETMRNLLWISQVLRIPAANILLGSVEGTTFDLTVTDVPDLLESDSGYRGPWRNRRAIEEKAWKFFDECEKDGHPSLSEVAAYVGLSEGGFRYLFPHFANCLVDTHRREWFLHQAALAEDLERRIQEIIQLHARNGRVALSRWKLERILIAEGRWSKNNIIAAVREAFDVMTSEYIESSRTCRARAAISCNVAKRRKYPCICHLLSKTSQPK